MKSSAKGTTIQMPTTPKNNGNIIILGIKKPKERIKEISADIFPLENAVNIAEEKILNPSNKNAEA